MYCLAQTSSLLANYDEIKRRDAEVVLVFPGPSDKVRDFVRDAQPGPRAGQEDVPFQLLLDRDCSACDRLGIRGAQAKPSTFILDKQGNVVYAYVGQTMSDRPSIKAVLAQLDKLDTQASR